MTAADFPTGSRFERSFQSNRIRKGKPQVGTRHFRPFLRSPRRWFEKMRNGETRPQGSAVAPIEGEQFIGRAVLQCRRYTPPHVAADPRVAEPFAFETEERHFIEWVRRAQRSVELQAIDDARRVAETDMLRSQVAMSVDNTP